MHFRGVDLRRVEHLRTVRYAIPIMLDEVGVVLEGAAVADPAPLHAELEVVGAGDVRQRRAGGPAMVRRDPDVEAVPVLARPEVVVCMTHAVPEPRPGLVVAERVVAGRLDAGHQIARGPRRHVEAGARPVRDRLVRLVRDQERLLHLREADLQQYAAADRRRPLRLEGVVVRAVRVPVRRGQRRLDVAPELASLELEDPVEVGAHLVALRHLRRQAEQPAAHMLLHDPLLADQLGRGVRRVLEDRSELQLVDRDRARRDEVPQLVADERAAHRRVHVVDVRDAVDRGQALCPQVGVQVVGLPRAVGETAVERPAEVVAAVLRDHVQPDAAGLHLGRAAGRRDGHLLRQRLVVVVHDPAVAERGVDDHAVDLHGGMRRVRPVRDHLHLLHHLRAAHVGPGEAHPLRQVADRLRVARGRKRVDGVALQHLGSGRALHVDHGSFTRDRDRLFERADRHLAVDRQREVRLELEAFLDEGREAGQRHRDGVVAGPQIDDGVPARAVGDREAAPFDQRRAGSLHGDARQDAPRVVAHLARDGALGARGCGQQRQTCEGGQRAARALDDCHFSSSWNAVARTSISPP